MELTPANEVIEPDGNPQDEQNGGGNAATQQNDIHGANKEVKPNATGATQQHYQQQQRQQQQRLPQQQEQMPPTFQRLQQPQQDAMEEEPSPFSDINRQLMHMGFPTWYIGNQPVEPVMSLLLLFVLLSVGMRGVILMGFIYLITRMSDQ